MEPVDRLESLDHEQCIELLGRQEVGRVGFVVDGQPRISPVNYRLIEGDVVFVSRPGAKLAAARRGDRVAFEVDAVEEWAHAGWSVLAVGHASVVTDPGEVARLVRLGPDAWAPTPEHSLIRVAVDGVTGRRVRFDAGDVSLVRQQPDVPRPDW